MSKNKEKVVYNHLKEIGEIGLIEELKVIKKGDRGKYVNIINSMFKEIQEESIFIT